MGMIKESGTQRKYEAVVSRSQYMRRYFDLPLFAEKDSYDLPNSLLNLLLGLFKEPHHLRLTPWRILVLSVGGRGVLVHILFQL